MSYKARMYSRSVVVKIACIGKPLTRRRAAIHLLTIFRNSIQIRIRMIDYSMKLLDRLVVYGRRQINVWSSTEKPYIFVTLWRYRLEIYFYMIFYDRIPCHLLLQ